MAERRARHAPAASGGLKPMLKWAGGKRQLLPQIRPYYPATFRRYVEPFLGSGAVFTDCHNRGLLDGREVWLSDCNADVIGCYRMVRDHVEEVIAVLVELEAGHHRDGAPHFYEVRDARFNAGRTAILEAGDPASRYTPELAAMLIYLNRTGFNGLFRLNARGRFNVPAGRYASPRVCDAATLRGWAAALGRDGVTLSVHGFEAALAAAGDEDFVYLDPPYAPVSATARFTAYTAAGFGPAQQQALQEAVLRLVRAGAWVILSNSVAPEIAALYSRNRDARSAGLVARTVTARRAINSRAAARGAVDEYLITNVRRSPRRLSEFV